MLLESPASGFLDWLTHAQMPPAIRAMPTSATPIVSDTVRLPSVRALCLADMTFRLKGLSCV